MVIIVAVRVADHQTRSCQTRLLIACKNLVTNDRSTKMLGPVRQNSWSHTLMASMDSWFSSPSPSTGFHLASIYSFNYSMNICKFSIVLTDRAELIKPVVSSSQMENVAECALAPPCTMQFSRLLVQFGRRVYMSLSAPAFVESSSAHVERCWWLSRVAAGAGSETFNWAFTICGISPPFIRCRCVT